MAGGRTFFRDGKSVNANALVSKLREDGKMASADPRAVSGFGADGVVGVAVHPPVNGFWTVVDSADGSQGIGGGKWCRASMIANHLGTGAIWYRVYTDDLALAVVFDRGSDWLRAIAGNRAEIESWLDAQEAPRHLPPPRDAGSDTTVVAIEYDARTYRSGPDAAVAAQLLAVRRAVEGGDGAGLREQCNAIDADWTALALGVIRAADGDDSRRCLAGAAAAIVAAPLQPRTRVKEMTADEEVLRLAAGLAAGSDDESFAACVDRLDAIEIDAEGRSEWANPGGLFLLAAQLDERELAGHAFDCYARVLRRGDEPAWYHLTRTLTALLRAHEGVIPIEGNVADVVRRCERRAPDLGQSAQEAVNYNLACVYARAGRRDQALAAFQRCAAPRAQNEHPERDTDLESLWADPAFVQHLARESVAEDSSAGIPVRVPHVVPPERAVPRQRITLVSGETESRLVSRLGGLPDVPASAVDWPQSPHRPMQLVFQLVGVAAGGDVDLGDVTVLQVFADREGDYYERQYQAVRIYRDPCPRVLDAPPGLDVAPIQVMSFEPGADDSLLLGDDREHDDREAAHSHAWCDKLRGIPVAANLDRNVRDSRSEPMDCLVQLVSFDDWFVWHLFVNRDLSEAVLAIVRG